MQNVVKENSELILDAGFTKSPSTVQLTDKEDIARALCLHYIVFKCKAELDQLKGGLHTLGVQTAMEVLPDEFKCLFTATKEILSPGTFVATFVTYTDSNQHCSQINSRIFFLVVCCFPVVETPSK